MQDRRVLPGSTDDYVHDEDGRPVFRVSVTSHDSLTAWLQPIARRLREGLGSDERILLAFDRGGAFSQQLAELRDAGIEFVTYERAPYPKIAATAFDRTVVVRGETYQLHESRHKNLGDKRGRIRRIALRTPDGKQINLVAISTASAEQLIAILLGAPSIKLPSGRWQQENAFHHGDARWGINQLDDRVVEPYPPGTVIPILLVGGSINRCDLRVSPREMHDASSRARVQLLAACAAQPSNRILLTRLSFSAISRRCARRPRRMHPWKRPHSLASSSATRGSSRGLST